MASPLPDACLFFSIVNVLHADFYKLLAETKAFTESRKKTAGYFSSNNWRGKGETVHEISLNAEYVREHSLKKTMALLAHQMVHLWQYERGRASRKGYHNREWALKMEETGLMPSDTGKWGAKKQGSK